MNTTNELTQVVDNLAGQWTEPALELLKAAGIRQVSVDMELETWQTLKQVLRSELRWQPTLGLATLASWSATTEQVLRKAVLLVARKFGFAAVSSEFQRPLRRPVGSRTTERILPLGC